MEDNLFLFQTTGHDRRYAVDFSKLQRDLGWGPAHSFRAGIEHTVRWYLENRAWVNKIASGDYRGWINTNYVLR